MQLLCMGLAKICKKEAIMNIQKILTISALAFLALNPLRVAALDKPIVLITSSSKNPPAAGSGHRSIGYWDVDDYDGNGGGRTWSSIFPPYKFDGSNHIASQGTNGRSGHYMATQSVNPRSLDQITNLRLLVDDKVLKQTSVSSNEYVVGWWDIDGGGGHGSDGSSGSRFMTLLAEYGTGSSGRKLLDLQLVASNRKTPASKSGYQMVGFWDVDKGGSGGTDGSTGSYMMTLLAKWGR